jgi:hypothetical protein
VSFRVHKRYGKCYGMPNPTMETDAKERAAHRQVVRQVG